MTGVDVTLGEVAASLGAGGAGRRRSRWRAAPTSSATWRSPALRSFVQLTAVGYVIQAIFDSDSLLVVVALLAAMVGLGTLTARRRAAAVPRATVPMLLALTVAGRRPRSASCWRWACSRPTPRYLVPVGGMVIGNAMTAAAVALNRLADEVAAQRGGSRRRWRSAPRPRQAAKAWSRGACARR